MAGKEEYRIYVEGLSWNISERGLEDAFSRYGKILHTQVMMERYSARSRGFGFITFANRRGMDNAIREMNGQEFGNRIISVHKVKPKMDREDVEPAFSSGYAYGGRHSFRRRGRSVPKMEGEDAEPGFGRGYLSGSRDSYRRRGRSVVRGGCFKFGCLGHWARDCPLVGGGRSSFSSRSWFERDGSEDCPGGDHDQYTDEQYDGGRCRGRDRSDSKDGEDGTRNCYYDDRMASVRETSNTDSSCSRLVDCENEEGEGDSEASSLAINFSQENARKMLATMILLDELPFKLVESERFHKFCESLQPKFVIPSRVTMTRDWIQIYLSKRKCLKNVLTQNHQRVCLIVDMWTSNDEISNHEGETVGRTVEKCLLEWSIDKVFTTTVANASSNDGVISYLSKKLIAQNALVLNGEFLYVRCCAHIHNLIVNDAWKDLLESINKVENVVKYVSSSPVRLQAFRHFAKEKENFFDPDDPTTWNSTHVLDIIVNNQKTIEMIKDRDPKFFMEATPSPKDWENIRAFVKLLFVLFEVTSKFSGSLCPTSNEYFHKLCMIQDLIRECSQSDNMCLGRIIQNMQAKFNKYWATTKRTNFLLYVAVVLDPRYKLKFVKYCFGEFWEDDVADKMTKKVERTLRKMCDEYFFNMPKDELNDGMGQTTHGIDTEKSAQRGSHASMADKFRKILDKEAPNDCKIEVDNYLCECYHRTDDEDFDVLNWWKLNSPRFKILSQMAKDVFAIPISTATSNATLNAAARVLDRFHCSCPPKIVEAIICAQNWLQTISIVAHVGDGMEDTDKVDQEFSKIAMEMDLDSFSD